MTTRRDGLARRRAALGFTQETLAERLRTDRTTIGRWERGTTTPLPWNQPDLAKALELSPEALAELLCNNGTSQLAHGPTTSPATGGALAILGADQGELIASRPHPTQRVVMTANESVGAGPLCLLDHAREVANRTLTTASTSAEQLDLIEERLREYVVTYTRIPPLSVLSALWPDVFEVQTLAAQRQPAAIQARLSEATAVLGLLSADALMKLGEVHRARSWYGTARLAADDTPNAELRASVRAQEAMLPYYYGRAEQTVALARAAQAQVPVTACSAAALAAAAEARALARLGDTVGAERAMNRARQLVDDMSEPHNDVAFHFNEKRLLLYLSGTLTYMCQHVRARRVQDQALDLYRLDPQIVIDPALIKLDQAVCEATVGNVNDACQRATAVLGELPAEHRTRIVLTRAADVVRAVPGRGSQVTAIGELRDLISSHGNGA